MKLVLVFATTINSHHVQYSRALFSFSSSSSSSKRYYFSSCYLWLWLTTTTIIGVKSTTTTASIILHPLPSKQRTTRMSSSSLPKMQKCIVYGKYDGMPYTKQIPVPSSGRSGHVLVRVYAAGLNPVDAKDVMGDKLPHSWTTLRKILRNYIVSSKIPGFDFAGVVVEEQFHHPTYTHGTAVFGTMPPLCGTLAEYISVPLHQICIMPSTLSFTEAAALPLVGLTAYQALSPHITTTPQQSKVLVVGGSGGTGHVALQVAKCLGVTENLVTICSTRNIEFCKACGATQVIDYSTTPNILEGLVTLSSSLPFTIVMDCVSSADPQDQHVNYPQLLQPHKNNPAAVGLLSDNYIYRRLGGPTVDWIRAGLERTIGWLLPSWLLWPNRHEKLFWIRFPHSSQELNQLRLWAEAGQLRPQIAQTYEFNPQSVHDAFDAILSRRVQGKVVVSIYDGKENIEMSGGEPQQNEEKKQK